MERYDFNAVSSGYGGATELEREESPDGDYVLYSDAAKLQEENEGLKSMMHDADLAFEACGKAEDKLAKLAEAFRLMSYAEMMQIKYAQRFGHWIATGCEYSRDTAPLFRRHGNKLNKRSNQLYSEVMDG